MSQSLTQIYLHLVFSTAERRPFLTNPAIRERIHAYLAGICRNRDSSSIRVGGVADHVHILCRLGKTVAVSDLARELKRDSTKWIKEQFPRPDLGGFHWQKGYGAFSISPSHVERTVAYIAGQDAHHATVSFQDEFRRLCRKYGVDLDERYVWD